MHSLAIEDIAQILLGGVSFVGVNEGQKRLANECSGLTLQMRGKNWV